MSQFRAAAGIVGVGIASAASVFLIHRLLVSDPPSEESSAAPQAPGTAAASSTDTARPFGAPRDDVDAPIARSAIPGNAREDDAVAAEPESDRAPHDVSPHIEALRHPSPEYRNVSLTTVIRAAGHVCVEVLSATPGTEDLGTWRVSCDGARAYLVSEDGAGGLRVEPMPFFEVPVRPPMETIPAPSDAPRPPLSPPQ